MENKDVYQDISSIKTIMERSTKFISLSGLAGVMAGVYALAGSAILYFSSSESVDTVQILPSPVKGLFYGGDAFSMLGKFYPGFKDTSTIILIGLAVMLLSICTGTFLTQRKANTKGQTIWNESSRSLLKSTIVPLLTGAFIILIDLWRGNVVSIFPSSLIFYGLALTAASKYTYGDVKWLGGLEILLGLIGVLLPLYGLILWALGFGVLHILYGTIMYFKYDRGSNAA